MIISLTKQMAIINLRDFLLVLHESQTWIFRQKKFQKTKILLKTRKVTCLINMCRIWALSYLYFPAKGQYWRFCTYMGKYGSEKTCILEYFMQCISMKLKPRKTFFQIYASEIMPNFGKLCRVQSSKLTWRYIFRSSRFKTCKR